MRRWKEFTSWKTAVFAALAAVLAFGTPASAQVLSTTTVEAVPSSVEVGEPVELTATVTCTEDPSGGLGVTFFDGGDILDTVPVGTDGVATYTATFTTEGTHTITAAYNGNTECGASNDETTVVVTDPPAPPAPPKPEFCLLICGSLIHFSVGDIYNNVIVR
ncbi:Ig-like domain-containing protein [Streptomyces radicis]|uniref:Ig-like domain repeat protein n=1 Tax=Streptomyces radicis TaxID=1750517 RepID=A0A3A9WCI4_9ACTN|nr:Ig-like domain-containing protein [Streptomyces radicis]RKN05346.1 Ig-like domain repeat protein [Streptomyces radicis]RKN16853.1 Ig-like domain repeat protein [Streptomyces radicis]